MRQYILTHCLSLRLRRPRRVVGGLGGLRICSRGWVEVMEGEGWEG